MSSSSIDSCESSTSVFARPKAHDAMIHQHERGRRQPGPRQHASNRAVRKVPLGRGRSRVPARGGGLFQRG
jgi:hypothetical protein